MVGKKTKKQRIKKRIVKLQEMMQRNRHRLLKEQLEKINQTLRGHYAYVTWDKFREIKLIFPILRLKLQISYGQLKSYAML